MSAGDQTALVRITLNVGSERVALIHTEITFNVWWSREYAQQSSY